MDSSGNIWYEMMRLWVENDGLLKQIAYLKARVKELEDAANVRSAHK